MRFPDWQCRQGPPKLPVPEGAPPSGDRTPRPGSPRVPCSLGTYCARQIGHCAARGRGQGQGPGCTRAEKGASGLPLIHPQLGCDCDLNPVPGGSPCHNESPPCLSSRTCPGTFPRAEDTARADLSAQRGSGYCGAGHLNHTDPGPGGTRGIGKPTALCRTTDGLPAACPRHPGPLSGHRLRSHAFGEPHLESLKALAARSEL